MNATVERRPTAALREMVVEASRSLAQLDAERLEELALCCQALNRDSAPRLDDPEAQADALAARREMAIFARVLQATEANVKVMERLRALRSGRLEYTEALARGWTTGERGHGDN